MLKDYENSILNYYNPESAPVFSNEKDEKITDFRSLLVFCFFIINI